MCEALGWLDIRQAERRANDVNGCVNGVKPEGLFIDWVTWLKRVSADRVHRGINFGKRIARNGVRTTEL